MVVLQGWGVAQDQGKHPEALPCCLQPGNGMGDFPRSPIVGKLIKQGGPETMSIRFFCVTAACLGLSGCEMFSPPAKNLEECLARAAEKPSADAMAKAEALCRQAFTAPDATPTAKTKNPRTTGAPDMPKLPPPALKSKAPGTPDAPPPPAPPPLKPGGPGSKTTP